MRDAVCVGIPDERFGETICAVVEPSGSAADVDADAVILHVKGSLAAYKAPRNVVVVETIGRAPNGQGRLQAPEGTRRRAPRQVAQCAATTCGPRLTTGEPVLMPGVWDALSVRLASEAGFDTVFLSGYCVSGTQLGLPDFGYLTQVEMAEVAGASAAPRPRPWSSSTATPATATR